MNKKYFPIEENTDKKISFKNVDELKVLSKKAFKEETKHLADYAIVGKLKPKCKDKIGELKVTVKIDENNDKIEFLDVARPDERNSIFTHKVGYVRVDEGKYIQVNKLNFLIIILFGFLIGVGIAVGIYLAQPKVAAPVKPLPEKQAETIPEDDPYYAEEDPDSYKDDGGNVSLVYTLDATKNGNTIDMMFKNPGNSTHGIVIQMYVENYLIAQSGLINPGQQLSQLTYTGAEGLLQSGIYDARYVLYFYSADSDEAVDIDATIPDVQLVVY